MNTRLSLMMIKSVLAGLLLTLASQGASAASTYTVRKGDTLWEVAQRTGFSVDALKRMNGLKSNTLRPGQRLALPGKGSPRQTAKRQPPTHRAVTAQQVRQPTQRNNGAGGMPRLYSSSAMVVDAATGQTLYSKNTRETKSIASITKLMTAMVALDAKPNMNETISISNDDVDHLKHTSSRLPIGTRLSRYEMMRLALMSSENRASSAISRHYPGGRRAFINAMNAKAQRLGMVNTRFADATGLTPANVSTAEDLVKMVKAASQYQLIRDFTTTAGRQVQVRPRGAPLQYKNSNVLVQRGKWDITVSKTGYTNEAGRCLVMMANVGNRPAVMVLLEANGKLTPVGDATRIKNWLESGRAPVQLAMADNRASRAN